MEDLHVVIDQLMPDFANPRIGHAKTKLEAIERMVRLQRDKIVALAGDIVKNGLSPIDLMMGIHDDQFPDHVVIVEGNRRATALILLSNRKLIESLPVLSQTTSMKSVRTKLLDMASMFDKHRIEPIKLVLAKDRASTRHWIRLRHGGELAGC